jgi:hypothetical protein
MVWILIVIDNSVHRYKFHNQTCKYWTEEESCDVSMRTAPLLRNEQSKLQYYF